MSINKKTETLIRVTKQTRNKLKKLGNKGDTYDTIINDLIKNQEL